MNNEKVFELGLGGYKSSCEHDQECCKPIK